MSIAPTAASAKAPPTAKPDDQKLPPKYEVQFKQVVKLFESKHYKKAVKSAEAVLKVYPNHGETLAMKGLSLSNMDNKEWPAGETPHQLAKLALMKNLRSHICWHVLGLLHRQDRNYNEAVKSYRNALKWDPENQQILKDLATLQCQIRDTAGLIETRNKLLESKPGLKQNWLGIAVAHHLAGNYEVAFMVLTAFEAATSVTESKNEISELQLYKIQVLMDGGEFAKALKCLHEVVDKVLDDVVLLTLQAECEYQTGDKAAAAQSNVGLLGVNPNCPNALKGYARAKASFTKEKFAFCDSTLTKAQRAELLKILDELGATLDSKNLQRQCLDLAEGDDLRRRLDAFARPYVKSNIPSLFSALKSLYNNPEAIPVIENLFLEWKVELTKNGRFASDSEPNPTCLLWVLIFLSMHFIRVKDTARARALIEEAIEHSPTVNTLYSVRAKILKHEGKFAEAAEQANQARKLDLADRYIANRCAKAYLRSDQIEEAEKIYALFSRAKEGEVLANVVELQCMWFEKELGESYMRQGDFCSALQAFLLIINHFNDFKEDQFDFHSYCLRKYTLRAYADMIRFHEDSMNHPVYQHAARRIVECYLQCHLLGPAALSSKICPHALKVSTQRSATLPAGAAGPGPLGKIPDLDKALDSAMPYVRALLKYSSNDYRIQQLAGRVFLARGKKLVAMKHYISASKLPGARDDKNFVEGLTRLSEVVKETEFAEEFHAVTEIKEILATK